MVEGILLHRGYQRCHLKGSLQLQTTNLTTTTTWQTIYDLPSDHLLITITLLLQNLKEKMESVYLPGSRAFVSLLWPTISWKWARMNVLFASPVVEGILFLPGNSETWLECILLQFLTTTLTTTTSWQTIYDLPFNHFPISFTLVTKSATTQKKTYILQKIRMAN